MVGDLMKSFSLLRMADGSGSSQSNAITKETKCHMEELARDYQCLWVTAAHVFPKGPLEMFIGAESGYNLYVLVPQFEHASEIEQRRLVQTGAFHLGELVNVFKPGCLSLSRPDAQHIFADRVLFGTANGSIGFIGVLSQSHFQTLSSVQTNAAKVIPSIGGLSHSE
ncbi:MAG: hypothetical protein ACREHV_05215 [Rhizomicrobium sp.]